MSDITESIDAARIEAEAAGCTVITGSEDTLLIDFDGFAGQEQYERQRSMLEAMWGIAREEWWPSRSGTPGHVHFVVTLNTPIPSAAHRVGLQAACGSDLKREFLAVRRMVLGVVEPSLLFRPSGAIVHEGRPCEMVTVAATDLEAF